MNAAESLPVVDNIDDVISYFNEEEKIGGLNVSRHLGSSHSAKTVGLDVIDKINCLIRINCIVNDSMLNDKLLEFINEYASKYRMINLRADYRNITTDNLKRRDSVDEWLLNRYKFEVSTQCLVCNSEFFTDEKEKVICYHRGMRYSSVTYGDRCYVNDIIIDPRGNLYRDWDMKEDSEFNEFLMCKNNNSTNNISKITL